MARPGAHMAEAELLQKLADIALMIGDAEAFLDGALGFGNRQVIAIKLPK